MCWPLHTHVSTNTSRSHLHLPSARHAFTLTPSISTWTSQHPLLVCNLPSNSETPSCPVFQLLNLSVIGITYGSSRVHSRMAHSHSRTQLHQPGFSACSSFALTHRTLLVSRAAEKGRAPFSPPSSESLLHTFVIQLGSSIEVHIPSWIPPDNLNKLKKFRVVYFFVCKVLWLLTND